MPAPRVRRIELASPDGGVQVQLEDGSFSSFAVATPDGPERRMQESGVDFAFGTPTLFVARRDEPTVGEAVEAMAADMGGYWLRYFNSLGAPARAEGGLKLPEGRKRRKSR